MVALFFVHTFFKKMTHLGWPWRLLVGWGYCIYKLYNKVLVFSEKFISYFSEYMLLLLYILLLFFFDSAGPSQGTPDGTVIKICFEFFD